MLSLSEIFLSWFICGIQVNLLSKIRSKYLVLKNFSISVSPKETCISLLYLQIEIFLHFFNSIIYLLFLLIFLHSVLDQNIERKIVRSSVNKPWRRLLSTESDYEQILVGLHLLMCKIVRYWFV